MVGVALAGVAAAWAHMAACSVSTEVVARAPGDAVRRVFALQEERKTEYKRVKMSEKNLFPCSVTQKYNYILVISHFLLLYIPFVINHQSASLST